LGNQYAAALVKERTRHDMNLVLALH
jgi:hypothetical protein